MIKQIAAINLISFFCLLAQSSNRTLPEISNNGLEHSKFKNLAVLIEPVNSEAIGLGVTEEIIKTKCEYALRWLA